MIKKITAFFTAAIIMLCSAIPCFAETDYSYTGRVVDYTSAISDSYLEKLNDKLDDLSDKWNFDIICILDTEPDGEPLSYADNYYDSNNFRSNCIILAVFSESRDWAIRTFGTARDTFTSDGQSDIISDIKSDMSDGDYYEAFSKFADKCDEYLQYEKDKGKAKSDSSSKNLIIAIAISVVIGVIVGFIGSGIMKSKLKSVRFQSGAANYVVPNSFKLSNSQDVYLYSTVTKTKRESESSGGSGSSGGGSRGGSSGKF